MKFIVILMRDKRLIQPNRDYNSLQDLQYAAGPIEAPNEDEAAELALKELKNAEKDTKLHTVTVLGHFVDGKYFPWLNGTFR